jgi:hypothetical protein
MAAWRSLPITTVQRDLRERATDIPLAAELGGTF